MGLNPQKMFNDKFGSPEQQNEEGFKQVFPKINMSAKRIEDLCKDVDLSKLGCEVSIPDGNDGEVPATVYKINVPLKDGIKEWTFCATNLLAKQETPLVTRCTNVFYELSKWGYAYAVYSQLVNLKENEYEVWVKLLTNNARANLQALQQKAPTEKYVEELAIAQNYEEYVKRTSQIATLKNTREMIRLAIIEPLKEEGRQLTNIIEVLKLKIGEDK